MRNGCLPLAMVSVGEKTRLERICGCEKMVQRLSALGFTPGVELSVIQDSGGPILISLRDSRIALGRGMAQQIMVSMMRNDGDKKDNEGGKEE
ncbi:MAG: ferrous iron transport protein A [Chloroflexi bacterium]|nr:ferrous iron transport protein A [Chloroflexota bacterium]